MALETEWVGLRLPIQKQQENPTLSAWPCLQILVVKRKFEIALEIVFE